jgi:hypothetical protein
MDDIGSMFLRATAAIPERRRAKEMGRTKELTKIEKNGLSHRLTGEEL